MSQDRIGGKRVWRGGGEGKEEWGRGQLIIIIVHLPSLPLSHSIHPLSYFLFHNSGHSYTLIHPTVRSAINFNPSLNFCTLYNSIQPIFCYLVFQPIPDFFFSSVTFNPSQTSANPQIHYLSAFQYRLEISNSNFKQNFFQNKPTDKFRWFCHDRAEKRQNLFKEVFYILSPLVKNLRISD